MTAIDARLVLFTAFQHFHDELLRLTAGLDAMAWAPHDIEARVRAMQDQLITALPRLDPLIPNGPSMQIRHARAAMAAVADERFTTVPWAGQLAWRETPLEWRVTSTRTAGGRVIDEIAAILERNDRADTPLAAVYFAALAVGFHGPICDADTTRLTQMRDGLADFLRRHAPLPAPQAWRLCPSAYVDVPKAAPAALAHVRPWAIAVAAGAIGLLAASQLLWWSLTGDVRRLAQQILSAAR